MNTALYLFVRRMRFPLVLLVAIFAFTVAGLALLPGVDANGRPTEGMGLFNAFYVITYTSTTIGFGELPAPYSTAQRLWMTFSIFLSVTGWSYSLVSVISIVQDAQFQAALRASRFAVRIKRLTEPFYIVCGFGETGNLVCQGLDRLGLRFVVIDNNEERLRRIWLEDLSTDVPILNADAAQPATLTGAGLLSKYCKGVVALAADDDTNRAIAVNVRLLAPKVPVLARVGEATQELNMGAFGGDIIVNPFERFAQQLAEAVAAPETFHLRQILNGLPGDPLPERHRPPKGRWIMCGYGRFGHRVREYLELAGLEVTVVDRLHYGEPGVDVKGTGTDTASLEKAGIADAVGIVAGNSNDLKNLAIAIVARELKPDIFIVTRQNQISNSPLFEAFAEDLAMEPSRTVAREFLAVITTPLLARFLELVPRQGEKWCSTLAKRLGELNDGLVPEIWSLKLDARHAPAVMSELEADNWVRVGNLMTDPFDRNARERAIVLLIARRGRVHKLPASDFRLEAGDEILFAGAPEAVRRTTLTVQNPVVLDFVRTGRDRTGGWLWGKATEALRRRRRPRPKVA